MKKKQRCLLKRFVALFAALMLCVSLCVPCLASGAPASMPSDRDFLDHPFSWYVYRQYEDFSSIHTYELICSPLIFNSSGALSSGRHFTVSPPNQMSFSGFSNDSDSFSYAFPDLIEPKGTCGSWRYYPSFPVGSFNDTSARVCCYAVDSSSNSAFYSLANSGKIAASVVPSPESLFLTNFVSAGTTQSIGTPAFSFSQFIYPTVRGPYNRGNTYATNWVAFSGLDNFALVTANYPDVFPTTYYSPVVTADFYNLGVSGWQSSSQRFSKTFTFPSSDARLWLLNLDSPLSALGNIYLAFSLFVPETFLPSDVEPGDWISHGTMDKLQDQLLNDFNVDSGTLEDSKNNLDSWSSTSSVESGIASGASGLLNGVFQNLGTFLFSVSLLCFGAVVLRMLIRKAVDG